MHPTKCDNVMFAWNIKIYEVAAALIVDQEEEIDGHVLGKKLTQVVKRWFTSTNFDWRRTLYTKDPLTPAIAELYIVN